MVNTRRRSLGKLGRKKIDYMGHVYEKTGTTDENAISVQRGSILKEE